MQIQIVDALRLGDRSKASNLLMVLGQEKCSLTADNFVRILSYCAKSPDPLVGFLFFVSLYCISCYYYYFKFMGVYLCIMIQLETDYASWHLPISVARPVKKCVICDCGHCVVILLYTPVNIES